MGRTITDRLYAFLSYDLIPHTDAPNGTAIALVAMKKGMIRIKAAAALHIGHLNGRNKPATSVYCRGPPAIKTGFVITPNCPPLTTW